MEHPKTEEEFQRLMEDIEIRFQKDNIPLPHRPLKAVELIASELGSFYHLPVRVLCPRRGSFTATVCPHIFIIGAFCKRLTGQVVRAVIARTDDENAVQAGKDASQLKNTFHVRPEWFGRVTVWDGDNYEIEFVDRKSEPHQ